MAKTENKTVPHAAGAWMDPETGREKSFARLMQAMEKAEGELEKVQIADEVTDELCEVCGRNLVIKYGPHGRFLACPGFP